jgi:two-component system sensor histidine kinase VicK
MLVIPDHPITKAYYKMKEQGIKIKFITDITKENLIYCRELMSVGEVRHLDEIKGNFGIMDGIYYRASAKSKESSPPPLLISSTMVAFVEQQQYFFDMLWKKSIPIKKRIKEIEEGLKREFIETIQDPKETLDLIPKIISSATEEILMIFSNRKILEIFENEIELSKLIQEQLKEENRIQIIIHGDKSIDNTRSTEIEDSFKLALEYPNLFEIQYITSDIYDRLNVSIVDRETAVIIESNKFTKNKIESKIENHEFLGLATYSNSESTISSYATIFDRLWLRAEFATSN